MPNKDPNIRKEYQKKYHLSWKDRNRDMVNDGFQRLHYRQKMFALEMYGRHCSYCGENKFELLVIDHINNDGKNHRKEYPRGGIYEWLIKNPFNPQRFQVLCHNCNAAKQHFKIFPGGKEYKDWEWWENYTSKRKSGRKT